MGKLFDRTYQTIFYLASPFLPWREPEIVHSYLRLVKVINEKKCQKALIVIDQNLVNIGIHTSLVEALTTNNIGYVVFSDVTPNPTINQVEKALNIYKEEECDMLIGFGGGSPIDVAKAVGARVVRPKKSLEAMGGILKVGKKLPLLIAIPTTAGTGSEATLAAVITNSETKRKYAINDHALIPHYAVLLPELTYGLPPLLTATTGMDALTHAIEAYTNNGGTKFTNKKAINAVKLIMANIEKVYDNPEYTEGRLRMQIAAYDAGVAFTRNYVGYVHALSHPLSAYYGLAHGYVNALILPFMLKEYGKKIHKKLAKLARLSGVSEGVNDEEIANNFIKRIEDLNKKFGIKDIIPEIDVNDIPSLAKYANKEARPLYPTPKIYKTSELEAFYHRLKGDN